MDKDQEAVKIAGFLTVAAPIITRLSRMVCFPRLFGQKTA